MPHVKAVVAIRVAATRGVILQGAAYIARVASGVTEGQTLPGQALPFGTSVTLGA